MEREQSEGGSRRMRSPSYSPRLSMSRSPPSNDGGLRSSPRRSASVGSSRQYSPDSMQSRSPRRRRDSQSPFSRQRHPSRQRSTSRHSIIVVGLSEMVYEAHLEQIFSMYGCVHDIVMPRARHTGMHNGIAYIVFQSAASVAKAEDNMNGGQIDGCIVDVRQEEVPRRDIDAAASLRVGGGGSGPRNHQRRHRSDRDEHGSYRQAHPFSDRWRRS